MVPAHPSPSRHGRVVCNFCWISSLGGFPRAKFVFLNGLSLKSSKQRAYGSEKPAEMENATV